MKSIIFNHSFTEQLKSGDKIQTTRRVDKDIYEGEIFMGVDEDLNFIGWFRCNEILFIDLDQFYLSINAKDGFKGKYSAVSETALEFARQDGFNSYSDFVNKIYEIYGKINDTFKVIRFELIGGETAK